MMLTYDKLGKNGRFGNQLFQIASTIGIALYGDCAYGFPDWEYERYFVNPLPKKQEGTKTLSGYLQDYKLFEPYAPVIREQFKMKYDNVDMTNEVFIHFRAYSSEGVTYYHPEQTKEYYEKAMQQFTGKDFIVFTDDVQKARKVLPGNLLFQKGNEMEDFFTMTQCEGGIISNSTFSWWAAWLMNKKTVIPKHWYTKAAETHNSAVYNASGLYVPNWITI